MSNVLPRKDGFGQRGKFGWFEIVPMQITFDPKAYQACFPEQTKMMRGSRLGQTKQTGQFLHGSGPLRQKAEQTQPAFVR
jgi:hypothetical protein